MYAPTRLHGEIAPDIWRGPEIQLIYGAACWLEAIICIF